MADDVQLSAAVGTGAVAATDDVLGVHYQKVKLVDGTADSTAAIPGDATNGLDVDVTRIIPGTTATALGKAEDVAHASGDVGVLMLAVRRDTAAVGSDTDGDNSTLNVDASGRLHVNVGNTVTVAAHAITDVSGTVSLPTGASTAAKQPALGTAGTASADVLTVQGIAAMTPLLVNGSGVTQPVSGTVTANLAAGTNNIGDVDVLTLPALAAGTNNIGDVDVLTLPGAAHDAAISGNPVRIAGRAMTADYASVTSGDTADILTTLNGKVVTQPYAIPENTWSYAAASGGITNTTGVTAKAAGAAGIRNYITHVDVVNGHATVSTDVQIRDGAAGTVLWRGFAQAAGGGVSATFDPPLKGTAATLVEIACGTTGTATYFNLSGYIGP